MRVVKSVMESEANISFRTILTVIAVASGGPEVATSDREMSVPVNLIIESLIGVGACSRLKADHWEGLDSDLTVTAQVHGGETAQVAALETAEMPALASAAAVPDVA